MQPKTIPFDQPKTEASPKTIPFDQSSAALAHSQQAIDQLRQKQAVSQQASQVANAPGTIAKETVKGTVGSFLDPLVKGARSVGQAVGEVFGAKPATEQYTGLAGTPQQTLQADVTQGKSVPMAAGELALDVASTVPVGKIASKGVSLLKSVVPKAAAEVSRGVSALGKLTGVTDFLAKRADKKALESSIDAVYSSPTGAKFKKTSGQVLTGKREITPASAFREQGLSPDEQTVNLGTRLKDLGLGKDPVKNTQRLADEFEATESKIQKALVGDPEVKYLADKQTLSGTLDKVKTEAPEEFRIKDSQAMVNRVVDFAHKTIATADDSIGGIREARKAFDVQAKREFPNAFKPDGGIDTKTPAGYAIKKVRDDINEHLYNTAPNGSEIQSLIGREADLYKAAQVSIDKALSGQGKTSIQQWIKENPAKAKILGYGAAATGGAGAYDLLH